MNSKVITIINVGLAILATFLIFKIYRLIMEPIEFDKIKKTRFTEVQNSLINIREAQLVYREEMGNFCGDLEELVAFVDTGNITITMIKDSTFLRYSNLYQTELPVDTVIKRVLGTESVRKNKFTEDFDINSIRFVPYSNKVKFELQAAVIERNAVRVSVFEASAKDTDVFYDIPERYVVYIDETHSNQVGSLTEPKISGNWQ